MKKINPGVKCATLGKTEIAPKGAACMYEKGEHDEA